MQDVDKEPAPLPEPVPVDPAVEGLYPVIDELEKKAIKAIKDATKKSTKAIEDALKESIKNIKKAIDKSIDAIEEAKKESIDAIKKANKESIVLSYRMLFAGAIFGFLGSFFVATLLKWYDAGWVINIYNDDFLLGILGIVAFVSCGFIVYYALKKVEQSKKEST